MGIRRVIRAHTIHELFNSNLCVPEAARRELLEVNQQQGITHHFATSLREQMAKRPYTEL